MSFTRLAAAAAIGPLLTTNAQANGVKSELRACAAYDHHVMMLVEDLGLTREAEADVLADAAMTVLAARAACRAGDYAGAFRLYETVALHRPRMTSFYRVLP